MLHVIEANNNHFYEYFNHYINKEWKREYFAYDHFKNACKVVKCHMKRCPIIITTATTTTRSNSNSSEDMFIDLQRQCFEEIKKVLRFIVNMILTIDLDLQTINEMLEAEGITVKKPSEMRTVMTRRASDADMIYSDQGHIARQSSVVLSSQRAHGAFKDKKKSSRRHHLNANFFLALWSRISGQVTKNIEIHDDDDDDNFADMEEGGAIHVEHHTNSRAALSTIADQSHRDRSIELSLRNVYRRIKQLEQFYHLNFYLIRKISKKIDKLLKIRYHQLYYYGENEHKKAKTTQMYEKGKGEKKVKQLELITVGNNNHHSSNKSSSNSSNSASGRMTLNERDIESGHGDLAMRQNICNDTTVQRVQNLDLEHKIEFIPIVVPKLQTWKDTTSGKFFFKEFVASKRVIEELKDECVSLYAKKFRSTYIELATYELEYVKEKDRMNSSTKLYVGVKFGLIACMVAWLLVDSYSMENHRNFNFWAQPGLFVYTTIGNLLLYRLCWAFNILIWSKYDINYISILHLKNIKPNQLVVINETATLLVFYFITLLIFFRVNVSYSSSFSTSTVAEENPYLSYGCPLLLLLISILYLLYEFFYVYGNTTSHGIFNLEVIQHCLQAGSISITFRDMFAADVLTSFTRIIADSLYASCWIVSGGFLDLNGTIVDFGSSEMQCAGTNMLYAVSIIQMIPLFIRTLQCLRGVRDDHFHVYPLGYNAIKYIFSILVVILGLTIGNRNSNGYNRTGMIVYYFFIILSASYKWWWDVVMDWGMFEVMPSIKKPLAESVGSNPTSHSSIRSGRRGSSSLGDSNGVYHSILPRAHREAITSFAVLCPSLYDFGHRLLKAKFFLRSTLMFPSISLYYFCILLDLVLRFLWVLSLLPPDTLPQQFTGYQLSFFLGSMEILRRCMWAMFRVEHEHLKMLKKKTPGFLSNRVMRKREDWLFTSDGEEGEGGVLSDDETTTNKGFGRVYTGDEAVGENDALEMGMGIRMRNITSKQANIPKKSTTQSNRLDESEQQYDFQQEPSSAMSDSERDMANLHQSHGSDSHIGMDLDEDATTTTVENGNNSIVDPPESDKTINGTDEINSRRLRLYDKKSAFDLPVELRRLIEVEEDSGDKVH